MQTVFRYWVNFADYLLEVHRPKAPGTTAEGHPEEVIFSVSDSYISYGIAM